MPYLNSDYQRIEKKMTRASNLTSPKIIYLTAGAGGMFCGSCLHDNALAKALVGAGWNVQLVPTYTPIRTDEQDVSVDHVLFGGLNVYLQQRLPFFRYLPMFVDRFLDSPKLIRRATARAIDTDAATLGSLALSMLKGLDGNQRKEVRRLVQWLKNEKPDLLIFTNLLIGGCLQGIKEELKIPVLVTLQGDDVFLDGLQPPFREKCMQEIKRLVRHVDGFIVHSEFFRQAMSRYFEIEPAKIHVTPLGIDVQDFEPLMDRILPKPVVEQAIPTRSVSEGRSLTNVSGYDDTRYTTARVSDQQITCERTIGYLARLAPEKGLHFLAEAFIQIKQQAEFADVKLKIAGWLGPPNLQFANDVWQRLNSAGLSNEYQYLGAVERADKLKFLREIDFMSVPTEYQEPKGLYALEAMAAGVPVVVPNHGAFPELIESSQGGLLFEPGNVGSLVETLTRLLRDSDLRQSLGHLGKQHVHQFRNAASMAESTGKVISQFLR